ncbi:hypothetical protein BCR35DRAFT_351269 [Leucosporidium creatinivorum]|uniref:F-box domain-containing protein n=1 Tax=Leucosporidium creatinivorum TaxID=106004 RepID=A0A1Y2FVY4_9BASI|nr:hypothetical protein BCR35DRAFT_351269 [Leucosporidium creatinivorum]
MSSTEVNRVPQLPNEVVHHIFEALWDLISIHPARDYAAVPPAPGQYFANALLVSKTWYNLALPFYVRWWSRGEPDRILEFVKEKQVGPLVRHLTMRAWSDVQHVTIPLRPELWTEMFKTVTHLVSLTVRVDRLDLPSARPNGPTATRGWIGCIIDTLERLPAEQRNRIRKLNLQFANDVIVIEDWVIHSFAEALPNVGSMLLQGFGPPTESGELSIVKTGRIPEDEARWWTGLKHLSLLHFQTQAEVGETSVATSILAASSASLKTLVIEEFVQQFPFAAASPLSDILGTSTYPSLNRLFLTGPPLIKGQETIFHQLPALTHLNVPIASRPPPHPSVAARPSLLENLPRSLTHLTLNLETLSGGWRDALESWIPQREALRYLSIDKEDPPDTPFRLMGLIPIALDTPPLLVEDMMAISNLCDRMGILFASADERLWGGNEDLWELEKEDEVASEGSGVGSSGVEEVEDFDAEDSAVFASRWSAQKRRDMAVANFIEALQLDLKPGIEPSEIERAVVPFLKAIEKE